MRFTVSLGAPILGDIVEPMRAVVGYIAGVVLICIALPMRMDYLMTTVFNTTSMNFITDKAVLLNQVGLTMQVIGVAFIILTFAYQLFSKRLP